MIDNLIGHEVISDRKKYYGSWSFFGILFSASFYFLLGVFLLVKTFFERYGGDKQQHKITIFLLFSIFSSGILYYVIGRFTMSHAFEFGTISAVIYFYDRLQTNLDDGLENSQLLLVLLAITLATFLVVIVRPTNICMLFIPLIMINKITKFNQQKHLKQKQNSQHKYLSLCMLANFAGLSLVFIFNYCLYGYVWPSPEFLYNIDILQEKGLPNDFLSILVVYFNLLPNLLLIFFSSEVGVIYTMPVIFLGLSYGIYRVVFNSLCWYNKALYFIGGIVVFGVPLAVVLLWQTTASDYNFRYLMGLIPISSILLAEMIISLSKYSRLLKVTLILIFISFCFSFLCFMFYKSDPLLFPSSQINAFGVEHGASLNGYVFNVIEKITYLKSWIAALGKGLPSILILPVIPENFAVEILPQSIYENYYPRFRQTPFIIYVQIFILAWLWGFFLRLTSKLVKSRCV
ncbi:hypothetical protein OAW28_05045 [Alphaproteobacteria bacterium]|nr:hypothetical protein [Alphaproteobacteria bacterium]